ncbi:unnamed protein product [Rotaria sp. Silwood2]|nr:unnamed protein product [Rotaria sp. Silwood2]
MKSELLVISFHLLAFIILMEGLFPYSSSTNNIANRSCFDSQESSKHHVIIMLIDALRSDYVFNRNNSSFYLKSIEKFEENGKALSFKLRCHTPTVTLPRLKALLTGTIPSFWDIIYNYNSSKLELDNILIQYKRKYPENKIVFYGDDTWIKLFPNDIFSRSKGLQSFFVTDFKEIDLNVTEGLYSELNQMNEWNLLIVHYLGLDHIGHAYGAFNSFIKDKLNEFDKIIENIYLKLNKNDILIITGDHGMADKGGHGGSSFVEINVPSVFISNQFNNVKQINNKEYLQIDLTPTLSGLLEISIPWNNLGILIEYVLESFYSKKTKSNLLKCLIDDNRRQLFNLLSDKDLSISYSNDLKLIRDKAMSLSNQQDFIQILFSILLFCSSTIMLWFNVEKTSLFSIIVLIIYYLISGKILLSFCIGAFCLSIIVIQMNKRKIIDYKRKTENNISDRFLIYYPLFHLISLFSSSFIEEEHQIWYFFLSTYLLLRTIEQKSFQTFFMLILSRFIRSWNQTGNKWLHLTDIGDYINAYLSRLTPLLYYVLLIMLIIVNRLSIEKLLFCLLYILCRTHNCVIIIVHMIFNIFINENDAHILFLFSQSAFFHLGNSNSFVTIDISSGFVGIPIYIPIIHGIFIYLSTYGLSIIWLFKLSKSELNRYLIKITLINSTFSLCILIQRYHLFVWTVFAPKLFYLCAQTAFNLFLFIMIK